MEKEYTTYEGWKRACVNAAKKGECDQISFLGNKDTCEAFFHYPPKMKGGIALEARYRSGGEWDGSIGTLSDTVAYTYPGQLIYKQITQYAKHRRL